MKYSEEEKDRTSDHGTWSGKTSLERSAPTKAPTLEQSSRKRSGSSSKKPPLFLCLKKDGQQPGASSEWVRGGAEFSIAYRVFDAQFWGVPQRRRRIALVADFGGLSAPEILFEREGLSGNPKQGGEKRERTAGTAERSTDQAGVARPSRTVMYCIQGNCIDRAETAGCNGKGWRENISYTLNTIDRPAVAYNIPPTKEPTMIEMTSTQNTIIENGISPTLTARMGTGGNQVNAVYCMDVGFFQTKKEQSGALLARQYKDPPIINGGKSIVRRLTPMECERLQGFPDHWTDIGDWIDSKGKKHKGDSDNPRYKALGNSLALPFWFWLMRRIAAQYARPATLGSLFDGIGGFPYVWQKCNGEGTALWASEVEEFAIAVTKKHFPEEKQE